MSTGRTAAIVLTVLWLWVPQALAEDAKTATDLFESIQPKAVLEDEDGRKYKEYEYDGEKFKVFEPKDGRMAVEGLGVTGGVSVHRATGRYRGEALGWGADAGSPKQALDQACRRMIQRAARPQDDELRKELEQLYESL